MDALLARYFDGELTEDEVTRFLETVDEDPALESELRAYEAVLAAARQPRSLALSATFTDGVMAELGRTSSRRRAVVFPSRLVTPLAAAAVVVLLFGAGWLSAQRFTDLPTPPLGSYARPAAWVLTDGGSTGTQYVRLVYRPVEPDVRQVTVAGSFNGWDPVSIPMTYDGRAWSAVLALPPGSYEYMFVEDGQHWVTDPLAPRARDDGFGGVNAVLDISA